MIGLRGQQHLPWEVKEKIFKLLNYKPFGAQEPFHRSTASHRIFAAGNRSGKTFCLSREVIPYLLVPFSYGWVVAKHYSLTQPIIDAIIEGLIILGHTQAPRAKNLKFGEFGYSNKDHKLLMWNGAVLEAKSGDNPDSLHARALDYCIVDEAALFPFYLYQTRLVPRLVDSGGWIAAIGTFEHDQGEWFEELWRIGQEPNDLGVESFTHPTTDNPYIDQKWLEEQRRILDPDIYAARFLAIPKPSPLRVLHRFSYVENVRPDAEFDPARPVFLAVDPGSTYAVGALQVDERDGHPYVTLVDEIYLAEALGTELVISKCRKRPWWRNVGRGGICSGAIDVMAKEQRYIWNSALAKAGKGPLVARKLGITANTQNLNAWLYKRWLVVNPQCTNALREVRKWQYPDLSRGDPKARVPKDRFNHLWKAIGYFLVAEFGLIEGRPRRGVSLPRPRWGAPTVKRRIVI